MTTPTRRLLLWSPRILGILVALFIGMFALDAFSESSGFVSSLPEFLIHAAPALVLLLAVALSWRWEWVGAVAYGAFAVVYGAATIPRVDWILIIAGPPLLVAVLFQMSWRHHGELHGQG